MSNLLNPYSELAGGGTTWLRGNIHTHTTASDGRHAPQDVVDWYSSQGYDFLAITDHNLRLSLSDLDPRGMILVPGEELTHPRHHLVGIGLEHTLPRGESLQEQIDLVREGGGLAIVAHPYWMGLTAEQIQPLRGHLAIEVSNQVCYRLNGKGDSVAWWDTLLSHGQRCWGVATDAAHILPDDGAGGWLHVAVPERSWTAIRASLMAGCFIASTGPRITGIQVAGRTVTVEVSGCTQVDYISSEGRRLYTMVCGADAAHADRATSVGWTLGEGEPFVRIEVSHAQGRRAWSQPFWSEER